MSTFRLRANDCFTDFDAVAGVAGYGDGPPSAEKLIIKAPADRFYGDLGLRFELGDVDALEGGPALRIIVPVPKRIDALDDEPVGTCFMQENRYKKQVFGMGDSLVIARERRPGRRHGLKHGALGASSEAEGCVFHRVLRVRGFIQQILGWHPPREELLAATRGWLLGAQTQDCPGRALQT